MAADCTSSSTRTCSNEESDEEDSTKEPDTNGEEDSHTFAIYGSVGGAVLLLLVAAIVALQIIKLFRRRHNITQGINL